MPIALSVVPIVRRCSRLLHVLQHCSSGAVPAIKMTAVVTWLYSSESSGAPDALMLPGAGCIQGASDRAGTSLS